MKVLIVLVLTVVSCRAAFLFSSGCQHDSDCVDGCCVRSLFTSSCHHHIGLMSRCPLTASLQTSCQNTCGQGLSCVDESKLDIALEPGHNGVNYGRCVKATGAVSATMPVSTVTSVTN